METHMPMIGSWQFFAGWIVAGFALWAFAWFFVFRDRE